MNHYHQLFAPVDTLPAHSYFSGGNSADGFRPVSGSLFGEETFLQLYILKGGPGTGKSTLMKTLAVWAEQAGLSVRRYFCGSDPTSLDGVTVVAESGSACPPKIGISPQRVGIIDGTAPHMQDPALHGISGTIVDLGQFLNAALLLPHRGEAETLAAAKKTAYAAAAQYLRAVDLLDERAAALSAASLLPEKTEAAASRLLDRLPRVEPETGNATVLLHAVTMKGAVAFPTFRRTADRRFTLLEADDLSRFFLTALQKEALRRGFAVETAVSPLCRTLPMALRLPELSASFVVADAPFGDEEGNINMERFSDPDIRRVNRAERRQVVRARAELFRMAEDSLRRAAVSHFRLEELYSTAMNFSGVQALTTHLSEEILRLLGV